VKQVSAGPLKPAAVFPALESYKVGNHWHRPHYGIS